jgi:hypothetical protein
MRAWQPASQKTTSSYLKAELSWNQCLTVGKSDVSGVIVGKSGFKGSRVLF